jgi:hypothetical protein
MRKKLLEAPLFVFWQIFRITQLIKKSCGPSFIFKAGFPVVEKERLVAAKQ